MGKAEMLSDIDFLDVTARPEALNNVPGQPVQFQLGTVPSYADASFFATELRIGLCYVGYATIYSVPRPPGTYGIFPSSPPPNK